MSDVGRRDAVLDLMIEVHEYRSHELYALFVRLLSAIDDSYNDDLRVVDKRSMKLKQGAARQCAVLRDALIDRGTLVVPKI